MSKCNCFDTIEKSLYNTAKPLAKDDRIESVTAAGDACGPTGIIHRIPFDVRWKTKAGKVKVSTLHVVNEYCPFCGIKNE